MPIDLITAHAYRSWHEDNPKGYVQRGEPGVQLPNAGPAEYRPPHADAAEVRFTSMQIACILDMTEDVCGRRLLQLRGATATHLHVVVSRHRGNDTSIVPDGRCHDDGLTGNQTYVEGGGARKHRLASTMLRRCAGHHA